MKNLSQQDLTDLVDGAAIFSASGGDPQIGHNIVERLLEKRHSVHLVEVTEIPDDKIVVNFTSVGATAHAAFHSDAAVNAFHKFEDLLKKKIYAVIPSELSGFSTLTAVDVAAGCDLPVVDADRTGRAASELHLRAYTLDGIPHVPMMISDLDGKDLRFIERIKDSLSVERTARKLASKLGQMVYAMMYVLDGKQARTSPFLNTLSKSIRIGMLLRKAVDPLRAIAKEANTLPLFEGVVSSVDRETENGFTDTRLEMAGVNGHEGSKMELRAMNEFLVAHRDEKLVAMSPDIITAVYSETCRCVSAEKIRLGDKLIVLGLPAPRKWRSQQGLELWQRVVQNAGINDEYVPIEKIAKQLLRL